MKKSLRVLPGPRTRALHVDSEDFGEREPPGAIKLEDKQQYFIQLANQRRAI